MPTIRVMRTFWRRSFQQLTRDEHLARKKISELNAQLACQLIRIVRLVAFEHPHIASHYPLNARKTEDFCFCRFIRNFRGALFLKPRATI